MRAGVGTAIVASESMAKQVITDDAVTSAAGGDFSMLSENMDNISGTQVLSDVLMDKVGGFASPVKASELKTMERKLGRLERVNAQNSRPSRVTNIANARRRLVNSNNINTFYSGVAGNSLQNVSDWTRNALLSGGGFSPTNVQPVAQDNTRVTQVLPEIR